MKQKVKLLTGILVLLVAMIMCLPQRAQAGGIDFVATLTQSTTSTQVGKTIVFTIHSWFYRCTLISDPSQHEDIVVSTPPDCGQGYSGPVLTPNAGETIYVSATGSGNTLSASSVVLDSAGNAQVTLGSSVAETKTFNITVLDPTLSPFYSQTVTFTPAPAAVAPPKVVAPKPVTVTTPAPAAPTLTPTTVAPPTPTITVGSSVIKPTAIPTVKSDQPLVLSGTTVPSGVVTLFVHSVLHTYTVKANTSGAWSYTIPLTSLPVGTHHIDAQVTDPATSKTSVQVQVLAFRLAETVAAASTNTVAQTPMSRLTKTLMIIGIVVLGFVLLVALAILYLWRVEPATLKAALRRLGLKKGSDHGPIGPTIAQPQL